MIAFISGMAAGAAALTGMFGLCCLRETRRERKERNKKRRVNRAAQNKKHRGFCGNLSRDNDWMTQELPKL